MTGLTSSEKTIVHVMRHGEVYNPDKILYGRLPDYHLSETGRAQAQRVADWLAAHDIVYVVASPLERAQETAAPIAERHGLADRHRRRPDRVGQYLSGPEGLTRRRRAARPPQLVASAQPAHAVVGRALRGDRGADDGRPASRPDQGAGHEAVCVSHQLPVETLRRAMTGKPLHHFPTRRLCNLASLTSFYFHGDSYVGWGYSELAGQ